MIIRNMFQNVGKSLEEKIDKIYERKTKKSLNRLDELDVKVKEFQDVNENFIYSINLNYNKLETLNSSNDYILEVSNAIKNHLDALPWRTIREVKIIGKEYEIKDFSEKVDVLYKKSEIEKEKTNRLGQSIWKTTILLSASAGMFLAYPPVTEFATDIANNINTYNSSLAPIAGLIQFGISSVGVLSSGVISILPGMFVGTDIARYIAKQNTLSDNNFMLSQMNYSQSR